MSKVSHSPERGENQYSATFEIERFEHHLQFTHKEFFGGGGDGFVFNSYQERYSFSVPKNMYGQMLANYLAEDVEEYLDLTKVWSTEEWEKQFDQAMVYFQDAKANYKHTYCYDEVGIPTEEGVSFEWRFDKGLRLTRIEDQISKLSNGEVHVEPALIDYVISSYAYPSLLNHFGFTKIASVFHNLFQGRNEFWDELESFILEQFHNEYS